MVLFRCRCRQEHSLSWHLLRGWVVGRCFLPSPTVYHMFGAGQHDQMRALLFDFRWLQARLEHGGVAALIADADHFGLDNAARLVHGALSLSAETLADGPTQLAGQLLGRPAEDGGPDIAALLAEARHGPGAPWLRPLFPNLTPPGSPHLRNLTGHEGIVYSVAVTPDGQRVASAGEDNTAKVWDLRFGDCLLTMEGHDGPVYSVAVTPDGAARRVRLGRRYLESVGPRLWDLGSGNKLSSLKGPGSRVTAVAVTPDGQRAICGSMNGVVQVWDLNSGAKLQSLDVREWVLAVSGDAEWAITRSNEGPLHMWDLKSGTPLLTLECGTASVWAVTVLPDGKRAVSASGDMTLKVWDLESGEVVTSFGGDGSFWCCAVAPDAQTIAAGDELCRVHFLRLEGV